ncbi:RHS repeat-associated core domain-containing protein [Pseudomonas sp. zfem002]|uniref:RHS repeat domain-containing protein n=1 Tax=Pseudomonas sp. zfem002 TaxID=3078197 RepID=UPI0029279195|nr:RHS repeat-associated core domain-containing protein [Pseudomonas sp. zfem002]MDU9394294.1 RHS repeat-associated core domain-containing protein [Pseudomonas sp. zfem002]
MSSSMHALTPDLAVIDSRHLPLRHVAYWRAAADQSAQGRVTLGRHDPARQSHTQWDPRLFERLQRRQGVAPSQATLLSLSGRRVLSESADAGWQLSLPGEAGQVVEHWDSRESHWQTEHDELLRPVQVREAASGQPPRIAERFSYARDVGLNRRGRLVRHDDDAGSRLLDGYSLLGQISSETRHFLAALDLPDWPETPDALLEPGEGATTTFVHGPLDQVLEQTDALGHRQAFHFTPSGELAGVQLILQDGTRHTLLQATRYNAFGQIETQTAGNGVVSHCEYDPANGRLTRLRASRPGRAQLQDLHYGHDPVGNLLRIEDHSQPVSHFANQRVEPVSTFLHDSLYQLIEASGREAAGAMVGPELPNLAPDPGDGSRLLNYRQHYSYDASGNLLTLDHVGQHTYTRTMNVAAHSNHAVPEPGDPLTAFDPNGNLLALQPGQPLQWNARNQLHATRQVQRNDGPNDDEHYRYGGDGLRVRKVVSRLVSGRAQRDETRYLPGLELHTRQGESFAVIATQAGHCTLRCLLWSAGKPEGIANGQLRYSFDDPHGSAGLELDGQARIISHGGWYPFGGSAWWAAHSAVEAGYRTRRYSGKERDASGLYDYGLRYYAPWLARWINPDPAGPVDGLNLFRAMRNNPMTWKDSDGREPTPAELDQAARPDRGDASAPMGLASRLNIHALPHRAVPYQDPFGQHFDFVAAELGDRYRIYFDSNAPSDNLIITAHAGFFPWTGDTQVPDGMTLGFFNPHGTELADPGLSNVARGSNKVFVLMQGKDFVPRKQMAQVLIQQGNTKALSGSEKAQFARDYSLEKYELDDTSTVTRVLSLNRSDPQALQFDVLTVRNRKKPATLLQRPSLGGVFRALQKHGLHYRAIYCLMCRGAIHGKPGTFDPKQARDA